MTYTTLTIIATFLVYRVILKYTELYRHVQSYTDIYRVILLYILTTRLVSSVPISCTNLGTTPLLITCCIHSTLPSVT